MHAATIRSPAILPAALAPRSTEIGKGLAQIEAGSGTLISFSTHPGAVASDGAGRNSPYAGALVKHLSSSNDDLNAILIAVRNDVMTATQEAQVPWEHSALRGRFYFNPASQTAEPIKVAPARLSEAAEAWGAAERTTSIAALEAFIARYKETFYAEMARARIEELKTQQGAPAKSDLAKQAEDRKRAQADAERQRLALVQQEGDKKAPKLESSPDRPFDGVWLVEAVASSGCLAKAWKNRLDIRGFDIYLGDQPRGRVESNGQFKYAFPNFNVPGTSVTISGRLVEKSGKGTYGVGTCKGVIAVTRE